MIVIITRSSIYPRDRENKPNDDHVACTTCSCLTLFDTNHNFLHTYEPMEIANLSRKISYFNHSKISVIINDILLLSFSYYFFFFFNNKKLLKKKLYTSLIKKSIYPFHYFFDHASFGYCFKK